MLLLTDGRATSEPALRDQVIRWTVYALMATSLAAAVLLKGGVEPWKWEWIALAVSLAALGAVLFGSKREAARRDDWCLVLMGVLLAWIVFQLAPLPSSVVQLLSPERWDAVMAARTATGQSSRPWFALSAAPAATIERLLQILPVIAAFVAAREMGSWWRSKPWAAVIPVIFVAWIESLIGIVQSQQAGTYVNHNHFAGLLELGLPLAAAGAFSGWRACKAHHESPAWGIVAFIAALCLWKGLLMSLSRMGIFSGLTALVVTAGVMLVASRRTKRDRIGGVRLSWCGVAALPILLFMFVPTRAMVQKYLDVNSKDDQSGMIRVKIWGDTTHAIEAYKWTGSGLGAYEQALYRHRSVAPESTVDFAHNDYLQILAELGFIGIGLMGALATRIVWRTFQSAIAVRNSSWTLALGLFGSFVALALHSTTDFNLYIPANALALAWLAGVADSTVLGET